MSFYLENYLSVCQNISFFFLTQTLQQNSSLPHVAFTSRGVFLGEGGWGRDYYAFPGSELMSKVKKKPIHFCTLKIKQFDIHI